jgi:replicative DNA helicase
MFDLQDYARKQLYSVEAEQQLLGIIIQNPKAFDLVQPLSAHEFYEELHQIIYEAMQKLDTAGTRIGMVTLAQHVPQPGYLADLATGVTVTINVKDYANIIRNFAKLRSLRAFADQVHQLVDSELQADSALLKVDQAFDAMDFASNADNLYDMARGTQAALQRIEDERSGKLAPISTGFSSLDETIQGGFKPGQLYVLAGRPGMGKTAVALNMAHAAAAQQKRTLFYSIEMPIHEMMMRLYAIQTGIPSRDMTSGLGMRPMLAAREQVEALPLLIDDTEKAIASSLVHGLDRHCRKGLDIAFIDHLSLIASGDDSRVSKVHQIEHITSSLKAAAKRLRIPVVLLCQLSREVGKRDDKTPVLTDLRDSGAIEQDADSVIFIHRPEYYLGDECERRVGENDDRYEKRHAQFQMDRQEWCDKAKLIVAKNRHGECGSTKLNFAKATMRFTED